MTKLFRTVIFSVVLGIAVIPVYGVHPGEPVEITREFKGPPKCGDKVDYELPGDHQGGMLVRGLVKAIPGQIVELTNDTLLVDGKATLKWDVENSKRIHGPLTIPEGYVFIIAEKNAGDQDSVVCGPIPINNIKKSVFTVVLP